MANTLEIQTIKDSNQLTVIKLTGIFDGSGQETNTARIVAGSLSGALDANSKPMRSILSLSNTALPFYGLSVKRIEYHVNMPTSTTGFVRLAWQGNSGSNGTIAVLNGVGSIGGEQAETITNPLSPVGGGGIALSTIGAAAGSSYTIILELRKDNAHFDRGQFSDPAAFNYPPYGLNP